MFWTAKSTATSDLRLHAALALSGRLAVLRCLVHLSKSPASRQGPRARSCEGNLFDRSRRQHFGCLNFGELADQVYWVLLGAAGSLAMAVLLHETR